MELAPALAEAAGRRLGSIRQLRWEDIDFSRRAIQWRAEFDKKGKEWVVPMPDSLAEELKQFRMRFGAIAGWIFAGERKLDQPMDRHLLDKWLHVAERKAKLPKLEGGLRRPPRPPDPGQVVGQTAPQTAPPLTEAQSTTGAIANGASR